MNKKTSVTFLPAVVALTMLLLLGSSAVAQQPGAGAQDARQALSTFPDAQVLMYINSRRLTGEALPRIVPPAELQKALGEAKKVGFDPTSVRYIAVGARFKEDASTPIPIPDVVVIVNGDFSADALVSMAKIAGQGKYTEETYGSRTLSVFDLNPNSQGQTQKASASVEAQEGPAGPGQQSSPQKPSMPFAIPQIAITALDPNTLLFGVTSYVKSAIDARDSGQGRLRAEFLDLATRQPGTLVSLVGDIPESLARQLQMFGGMPQNDEVMRHVRALKRVQVALTMNAADFGLHSVLGMDTAEHARSLNGMVTMGIGMLRGAVQQDIDEDAKAHRTKDLPINNAILAAVNSIHNAAVATEVQLSTSVPQTTVAELVRSQTAPKATTPAQGTTKPTRPRSGRTRRRK